MKPEIIEAVVALQVTGCDDPERVAHAVLEAAVKALPADEFGVDVGVTTRPPEWWLATLTGEPEAPRERGQAVDGKEGA